MATYQFRQSSPIAYAYDNDAYISSFVEALSSKHQFHKDPVSGRVIARGQYYVYATPVGGLTVPPEAVAVVWFTNSEYPVGYLVRAKAGTPPISENDRAEWRATLAKVASVLEEMIAERHAAERAEQAQGCEKCDGEGCFESCKEEY